jgi:hypothetical protein
VVLVGPPQTRTGHSVQALVVDAIYRERAQALPNVVYLNEFELLTPGGQYADVLPCTFLEPCEIGTVVPVRAEDGGHLCRRDGYCHGGFRMALAITDALTRSSDPDDSV